jgi:hypothetical protein
MTSLTSIRRSDPLVFRVPHPSAFEGWESPSETAPGPQDTGVLRVLRAFDSLNLLARLKKTNLMNPHLALTLRLAFAAWGAATPVFVLRAPGNFPS